MKKEALVELFRSMADDTEEPPNWATSTVELFLNAAEAEAAERANLLPVKSDPTYCTIQVTSGENSYALHSLVYEITRARVSGVTLRRKTAEVLDTELPGWEDQVGAPLYFILSGQTITLVPSPVEDTVLSLEVYRLPIPMTSAGPEIHPKYHAALLDWVLFLAYSKRDVDIVTGADTFAQRFELTFGPAQTANTKRQHLPTEPTDSRPDWNI